MTCLRESPVLPMQPHRRQRRFCMPTSASVDQWTKTSALYPIAGKHASFISSVGFCELSARINPGGLVLLDIAELLLPCIRACTPTLSTHIDVVSNAASPQAGGGCSERFLPFPAGCLAHLLASNISANCPETVARRKLDCWLILLVAALNFLYCGNRTKPIVAGELNEVQKCALAGLRSDVLLLIKHVPEKFEEHSWEIAEGQCTDLHRRGVVSS